MSFSMEVKNEISNYYSASRHCNIAEIAAIINFCGSVSVKCEKIIVKVQTENYFLAQKFFYLLNKVFNINAETSIRKNNSNASVGIYSVYVANKEKSEELLMATGMLDKLTGVIKNVPDPLILNKSCCKRAYIRGGFLAIGSINEPKKNYHLEFVDSNFNNVSELKKLLDYFEIEAKIIERKAHFVLYIKEGGKIVDFLNVIGAHISLMDLENMRILKDMRNNVNRIVNCETANLSKTVTASVQQVEAISYIRDTIGLQTLPEHLQEVAEKRLLFPDLSLKELSEKLSPPVGKSGLNHRLKKIISISDNMKEKFRRKN